MQIHYQLTVEDIAAFNVHHSRTSRLSRRRLRLTQLWGIFCTLVVVMIWPRWSSLERALFFLAFCSFWLLAYPVYYPWVIKRNARKIYSEKESKGVLGKHSIAIRADGVTERSAVGESRTGWEGIERIAADGQYVYLYIGPLQAHVIPKRAFQNDEEVEAFLQLAQTYRLGNTRLTSGLAGE